MVVDEAFLKYSETLQIMFFIVSKLPGYLRPQYYDQFSGKSC